MSRNPRNLYISSSSRLETGVLYTRTSSRQSSRGVQVWAGAKQIIRWRAMHSAYRRAGKCLGIKSCRTFGIIFKPKAEGVFCDSRQVVRRLGVELAGFDPEQTLPLTESDI